MTRLWHSRPVVFGALILAFALVAAACSLGMVLNGAVTLSLVDRFPGLPVQVAALAGIAAGTFANYLMSRFFVFERWQRGA